MKKLDHNVQLFCTRALFYFLIFLIAFSYLKRHFADWVLSSHHLPEAAFPSFGPTLKACLPRFFSLHPHLTIVTTFPGEILFSQLHMLSCSRALSFASFLACFPFFFPAPLEHTPGAESFKRPPSLTKDPPENRSLLALFICRVHIVIFSWGGRGVGS